jgi:hypothetical protein
VKTAIIGSAVLRLSTTQVKMERRMDDFDGSLRFAPAADELTTDAEEGYYGYMSEKLSGNSDAVLRSMRTDNYNADEDVPVNDYIDSGVDLGSLELEGRFSRHEVGLNENVDVDDALFQREFESYQATIHDAKLSELNRDQIRSELDRYLTQSLNKKGSDGKSLLSVPDNFEVIAASMSRNDLNSSEAAPWSKVSVPVGNVLPK